MGQILNNLTIIKSITIIIVYTSPLKKKKNTTIFLYSHTHKLSFSKGGHPFSFLFSLDGTHVFLTVWHLLFLLVCVVLFSTPHACLSYIQFCHLTLLGTYGVLAFHVSPNSSWNRRWVGLSLLRSFMWAGLWCQLAANN